MSNYKNILIVRTDRIGDVVLTTPLAKLIKQKYPNAKVTFLVRDYTREVVENNKFIDNVLTLPIKNQSLNFSELLAEIKAGQFDAAIIVYPKFLISLALYFAKIKKRVGSGYRWFSFLFTDKIYEHRRTGDKHELEYNLNLLKPIGIEEVDKNSVDFDIQTSQKSEQTVNDLFKQNHLNNGKKVVIVHPGSGGSSIDLPITKFIALTKMLAHELDYNVVVTGSENEKETCNKLLVHKNVVSLAGELSLSDLISVISKAELLIANSTGPIHIAAALRKYVVGFYPKINECSVERWGPFTEKRLIYSPTIGCEKCTRKQCERLNCMESIDINLVTEDIKKIIE